MEFPRLIEGRLLRRYKRFLADIELSDGSVVVAHCPNPGSMKTMKEPGSEVWLSESTNPKRKLAYTWELMRSCGDMTLVNAGRANAIVAEALHASLVRELSGFDSLRSEVPYGKSRIDFALDFAEQACFVEVKNVTMADGESGLAFPDSVTARGTKHLHSLMAMVSEGKRACLLFCCSRAGATRVRPADEIDPVYGATLREAKLAGVELLAYACALKYTGQRWSIVLQAPIPIVLD